MDAVRDKLKIIGFDVLVDTFNAIVVISSYIITCNILNNATEANNFHMEFIKGAFVFIGPCAIEGINLLTSKSTFNSKILNKLDVFILVLSIGLTILTAIFAILDIDKCILLIEIAISVYPIKIVGKFALDIMKLNKERNA